MQVNITVKDFSQPHQLYVPEYGGQFYIIMGVFAAVFVGSGTIALFGAWGIVLWNVRVAKGYDTPWWADTAHRYGPLLVEQALLVTASIQYLHSIAIQGCPSCGLGLLFQWHGAVAGDGDQGT